MSSAISWQKVGTLVVIQAIAILVMPMKTANVMPIWPATAAPWKANRTGLNRLKMR
ncbi:hypothetical protein D3C81_2292460 [compost metagenome]